jgi:hypothetical protein
MLQDIAGNFRRDDPESIKMLELIFTIEKTLVDSDDLLPHFAMIIARRQISATRLLAIQGFSGSTGLITNIEIFSNHASRIENV